MLLFGDDSRRLFGGSGVFRSFWLVGTFGGDVALTLREVEWFVAMWIEDVGVVCGSLRIICFEYRAEWVVLVEYPVAGGVFLKLRSLAERGDFCGNLRRASEGPRDYVFLSVFFGVLIRLFLDFVYF